LGLDGNKPIYWPNSNLPHFQICGTTGSGKGVSMQIIVSQCILAREAVFFVDPKNDEYLIHVFKKIADEAGIPFHLIDLTKDIKQFNIFLDANFRQIKSLLEAGFTLERTGKPSDFYKNADRDMAETIASIFKEGDTAESLYR